MVKSVADTMMIELAQKQRLKGGSYSDYLKFLRKWGVKGKKTSSGFKVRKGGPF